MSGAPTVIAEAVTVPFEPALTFGHRVAFETTRITLEVARRIGASNVNSTWPFDEKIHTLRRGLRVVVTARRQATETTEDRLSRLERVATELERQVGIRR